MADAQTFWFGVFTTLWVVVFFVGTVVLHRQGTQSTQGLSRKLGERGDSL